MGKALDLTGKVIGDWTVVKEDPVRRLKTIWWWCRCVCGAKLSVRGPRLVRGESTHCGCRDRTELLDRKFGRLTVKKYGGIRDRVRVWLCRCDCGMEIVAKGHELKRGNTSSCGCWRSERIAIKATRHGKSYGSEYHAWSQAKHRCFNKKATNYKDYGGRGITMAPEWVDDFAAFLHHIGMKPTPNHTLDRINNSGNYEPGNVRWATLSEQQRNRRPYSEWSRTSEASA